MIFLRQSPFKQILIYCVTRMEAFLRFVYKKPTTVVQEQWESKFYLPDDLWILVLSFLDSKTLVPLRTVCTSWNVLITKYAMPSKLVHRGKVALITGAT